VLVAAGEVWRERYVLDAAGDVVGREEGFGDGFERRGLAGAGVDDSAIDGGGIGGGCAADI